MSEVEYQGLVDGKESTTPEYAQWVAVNAPQSCAPPSPEVTRQAQIDALASQLTPADIVKILAIGDKTIAVQLDAQIEAVKAASVASV